MRWRALHLKRLQSRVFVRFCYLHVSCSRGGSLGLYVAERRRTKQETSASNLTLLASRRARLRYEQATTNHERSDSYMLSPLPAALLGSFGCTYIRRKTSQAPAATAAAAADRTSPRRQAASAVTELYA